MLLTTPSIPAPILPSDLVQVDTSPDLMSPMQAAEKIVQLLTELKGKIVTAMQSNVDHITIQQDISADLTAIMVLAPIAGYDGISGPFTIDVVTPGGAKAALGFIEAAIQSAIDLTNTLGNANEPDPVPVSGALEATKAVIELLHDVKELVVVSFSENVDRAKIQTDLDAILHQIQHVAEIAGYESAPDKMDVQSETGRGTAMVQVDLAIQSAIAHQETLEGGTDPEPVPDLTPFEAAEAIVHVLTSVKAMVIASYQENVDRAKIQADIDAELVKLQSLAPIAGYASGPIPMAFDVQTEMGRNAAAEYVEASIQSAIELSNTLGGGTPQQPNPELNEIEAAEAIVGYLTEIKVLVIMAQSENVDLEKLQTDIHANLSEISKLAVIVGYDGLPELSKIDVFDPASLEAAQDQVGAEVMSLIELLEDLNSPDEDLHIRGTRDDDEITTGSGDDVVEAARGDDLIDTGDGDDDVRAGRGDDVVFGGAGDDDLSGGRGADMIDGGDGDDNVRGGRGDDVLTGGVGDDDIFGGKGDDALFGDNGDDYLSAGRGDDALDGGQGDDILKGGRGDDVFVFEGSLGHDKIVDFNAGGGDDRLVFIFHDDAFASWTSEDILNCASQQGRHVVIDFESTGDSVTLARTNMDDLTSADIDVFNHV